MRRKAFSVITLILSLFLLSFYAKADTFKDNMKFGIIAAKKKLWKEAYFRFKRAVALNPRSAKAYNNLAVACEALGKFEEAEKYYKKALHLDPKNRRIRTNYAIFQELVRKRIRRPEKK